MSEKYKIAELKKWCEEILDNYKPSEFNYENRFKRQYEAEVTDTLRKIISKINAL